MVMDRPFMPADVLVHIRLFCCTAFIRSQNHHTTVRLFFGTAQLIIQSYIVLKTSRDNNFNSGTNSLPFSHAELVVLTLGTAHTCSAAAEMGIPEP